MSLKLSGLNPRAYIGVEPSQPPQMLVYKTSPTPTDLANIGTFWLNFNTQKLYILTSVAANVAMWQPIASGGGIGASIFQTNGTPATQVGGVIQIVGDGQFLTTNGSGNTVTVSFVGGLEPTTEFETDSGEPATPDNGVIKISGTDKALSNINTSSTGTDEVFVALNNSVLINNNFGLNNSNSAGTIGLFTYGGTQWMTNIGTLNTFVGQMAGNLNLTTGSAQFNTGIGAQSLQRVTTGASDSAFGYNSLTANLSGSSCTAIGASALAANNSGSFNTAIGSTSLTLLNGTNSHNTAVGSAAASNLLTGNTNIIVGSASGSNYVGAESNNIIIGSNSGVASENNVLRIGGTSGTGTGQQNAAFISGIYPNATALATNYGVTVVDSSDNTRVLLPSAQAQLLTSQAGGVFSPLWKPLTSVGGSVAISLVSGSINLEATGANVGVNTFHTDSGDATGAANAITIHGGSNINTSGTASTVTVNLNNAVTISGIMTAASYVGSGYGYGALISNNTGTITSINGTVGQVLTANGSGAAPTWTTIATSGLAWNVVSTNQSPMLINNGYICNGSGRLTLTLPTVSAVGNIIEVVNLTNGWTIAQNAGQQIIFATTITTSGTGGSLSSTNIGDTARIVCYIANTDWIVLSSVGNAITVV